MFVRKLKFFSLLDQETSMVNVSHCLYFYSYLRSSHDGQ